MYKKHILLAVLVVGLIACIRILHPLSFFSNSSHLSPVDLPASAQVLNATLTTTTNPTERILFLGGGILSQNQAFNDVLASADMQQWNVVSPDGATPKWSKKFYPEALYFNGKYWVIGGLTSSTNTLSMDNSVWSSSDGVTWTETAHTTPFAGYSYFKTATLNGKIYVIGGKSQTVGVPSQSKVWSSSDGVTWTTVTSNAPFHARAGHTVVSFNGKIYVIGGIDLTITNITTYLGDVWSSTDGLNWSLVTSTPPFGGISYPKGLVYQNKIFLLGGTVNGTSAPGSKVWSSPDGVNWSLVSATMPYYDNIFSSAADAVVANGKIWLGNGTSVGQSKLWSTADGITWTQGSAVLPWSPRYGYRLVSGPTSQPPASCTINALTVPANTPMATQNVAVTWSVSNCSRIVLIANSGTYTTRYDSTLSSGTYTFTKPQTSTISTKDNSIDITLIASNDSSQIVSMTKSVPIVPVSGIVFPNQCDITNLSATPNPVPLSGNHYVTLNWSIPTGCGVTVDGWSRTTGVFQLNPSIQGIYVDSNTSLTTTITTPTTFYVIASKGGNLTTNTKIINAKTIDVQVQ